MTKLRQALTTVAVPVGTTALTLLVLTMVDRSLGMNTVHQSDTALQLQVHHWTSPSLTLLMLALTAIGSIKVFLTVASVACLGLYLRGRAPMAYLLAGALAGALVLNETLKLHFHRARPVVPWSIGDEPTFSFPSGHSLFAMVLYGMLAILTMRGEVSAGRRLLILLAAATFILGIGVSRVYLGMHYPTDVCAGYLTGALWLVAVLGMERIWSRRTD